MNSNLRTLGPFESKVVLSMLEDGQDVIRAAEIVSMLGSEQTARKVIRNLLRKGWFSRLVGGRYILLPPEYGAENLGENNILALAGAVVDQSYVGWWSAAAFHGFTTQKPMTVFVAVKRQTSSRFIEGAEIRFVKVAPRKFFGFDGYNVYGRNVQISTPVKTLVDCVDRPDLSGGPVEIARIVHAGMNEIDPEILADVAINMRSISLLQRLGFFTDLVGRPLPEEVRNRFREKIPVSTRSVLGRQDRKDGDIGYVAEWRLLVNASTENLLAEVPQTHSLLAPQC